MIPFVDLRPVSQLVAGAVLPRWSKVLAECEFVGGAGVQQLERELASYCGTHAAVACANGTDALLLALQASGVKPGMHVALPNMTFWATYEAVAQLGGIPVLVDISLDDLQMDFEEFKRAHEKFRFRHALLVHLYGWASSALAEFRAYCKENDIRLIEDGAQVVGARIGGRSILAGAEVATLSFYPAKVIGGCMDGGAVLASNDELAATVRSLANHGRSTHYSYAHVGWNSRMGGLQAHYLLETLKHADAIVDERRRLAASYRDALGSGVTAKVRSAPAAVQENGYLAVLQCARPADEYLPKFKERGVSTGRTYPETMDEQPPARGQFVAVSDLQRSRDFVKRVLNLPLFFGLSDHDQTTVIGVAREILI